MSKIENLAKFPIFGICFYKKYFLISGGGGGQKFALRNEVHLFETSTRQKVKSIDTKDDLFLSMNYLKNKDLIIGALGKDIAAYRITPEIQLLSRTPSEKSKTLSTVKPYENESKVITAGEEGNICLWTIDDIGKAVKILQVSTGSEVFTCDCSGDLICATLKTRACVIYSAKTGNKLKILEFSSRTGSTMMIRCCSFLKKDILTLATEKGKSFLIKWNIEDNFFPYEASQIIDEQCSMMKLSQSSALAAIGSSSGKMIVVDLAGFQVKGKSKEQFELPSTCCDFNENESKVLGASADTTCLLIDVSGSSYIQYLFLLSAVVVFLGILISVNL